MFQPATNNHQPTTNNLPLISQQPPVTDPQASLSVQADLEVEVLEFFIRVAQLVGQPRSIGEIYGLLYLSTEPLSMESIVNRLKISTGSASQGLKQLRSFRAVRTTYVPGDRRDYYVAEEELRKVLSGFMQEGIEPHLESSRDRIGRMEGLVAQLDAGAERDTLTLRVKRLTRLHRLINRFLPTLMRFVKV